MCSCGTHPAQVLAADAQLVRPALQLQHLLGHPGLDLQGASERWASCMGRWGGCGVAWLRRQSVGSQRAARGAQVCSPAGGLVLRMERPAGLPGAAPPHLCRPRLRHHGRGGHARQAALAGRCAALCRSARCCRCGLSLPLLLRRPRSRLLSLRGRGARRGGRVRHRRRGRQRLLQRRLRLRRLHRRRLLLLLPLLLRRLLLPLGCGASLTGCKVRRRLGQQRLRQAGGGDARVHPLPAVEAIRPVRPFHSIHSAATGRGAGGQRGGQGGRWGSEGTTAESHGWWGGACGRRGARRPAAGSGGSQAGTACDSPAAPCSHWQLHPPRAARSASASSAFRAQIRGSCVQRAHMPICFKAMAASLPVMVMRRACSAMMAARSIARRRNCLSTRGMPASGSSSTPLPMRMMPAREQGRGRGAVSGAAVSGAGAAAADQRRAAACWGAAGGDRAHLRAGPACGCRRCRPARRPSRRRGA